jgi:hypothetical protein
MKVKGLNKREYFAIQVLQGMIDKATISNHGELWIKEDNKRSMIRFAVEIADKLAEELNKQKEEQ